jgi:hypothetical protein
VAGFGRAPFGSEPFGISDTGVDLIVESFPPEYFNPDLVPPAGYTIQTNPNDPLVSLLTTYANSVFQRRLDVDNLPELVDPDIMPLNIVELWGGLLGLGIDQNDPAFLQVSFLKYASQWLQIKASTKGYEVRGLASGFAVQVQIFWRVDPSLEDFIPLRFQYFLKPAEADARAHTILHTNKPPGTFPGTPTVENELYAKSAYVQPIYSVPIYQPNVDYNTLLNLVIYKITDVVGIHHELLAQIFQVIMNVYLNITVAITEINESIETFEFNEACYFDIIPSDEEPTDMCLGVVMITDSENENIPVNAVPTVGIIIEENIPAALSITLAPFPMTGTFTIDETSHSLINFPELFDAVPADMMPLDGNPYVTIEQAA